MPIFHPSEDRFPGLDTGSVLRIHRIGLVLGLIAPLAIVLAAALISGQFTLWPTTLVHVYERLFQVGWPGFYALGLLALVLPVLLEQDVRFGYDRAFNWSLGLYAVGVLVSAGARVAVRAWGLSDVMLLAFIGDLGMITGWLITQKRALSWMAHRKTKELNFFAVAAGMIIFLAALGLHAYVDFSLWLSGRLFAPLSWLFVLRALPIFGSSLIFIGLLLRLAPESLGWRPIPESRLKWVYAGTLAGGALLSVGYPAFHLLRGTSAALVYGVGAVVYMAVIVLLFMSIDLLHVRVPAENRSHVLPLYSSLVWLLISTGFMVVLAFWEISHRARIAEIWVEPLLYATITGFMIQFIFGIYTYIANQVEGSYPHSDRLMTWSVVLLNWVLVMRIFIYPLTVSNGWDGAEALRFGLEALMYVALLLLSADLLISLGGPIGRKLARLKK